MKLLLLSAAAALIASVAHAQEYNIRGSPDVREEKLIYYYYHYYLLLSLVLLLPTMYTSCELTYLLSLLTFSYSSHLRLTSTNWIPMKYKICSCLNSPKTLTLKITILKSLMMKNTSSSKSQAAVARGEGTVVVMSSATIVAVV